LIQPATLFDPRINQLDLRLSKTVRIGGGRVQANFDLYNAFNRSTALVINNTYGSDWLKPTQIMDGRLAKFGVEVTF
jgi:hypothetical protein